MPESVKLPCFVYGLLKPGELGFRRLKEFVSGVPVEAAIAGKLWIRDGLPLLEILAGGRVGGYLLRFDEARARGAYDQIAKFEPKEHYKWEVVQVLQQEECANVLVGKRPKVGAEESEFGRWTSEDDPVFTEGIAEVRAVLEKHGHAFGSRITGAEWRRLFRLQMAYLLLWSAIERYAALSYGPGLKPGQRVTKLGEDPLFASALARQVDREDTVVSSEDPSEEHALSVSAPVHSANYFYKVRSNLSHRGKGAWREGEKVRLALRDLLEIFGMMLKESVFRVRP